MKLCATSMSSTRVLFTSYSPSAEHANAAPLEGKFPLWDTSDRMPLGCAAFQSIQIEFVVSPSSVGREDMYHPVVLLPYGASKN